MYFYIVRADLKFLKPLERVKFGITGDPKSRLMSLMTGSPVSLEYLVLILHSSAPEIEKRFHHTFRSQRHHGEWFTLPIPILSYMYYNLNVHNLGLYGIENIPTCDKDLPSFNPLRHIGTTYKEWDTLIKDIFSKE